MLTNRSALPLAALAAAALYTVTGVLELAHEQVNPFAGALDYAIEAAFLAALAVAAAACWELRRRGARVAWTIAAAGHFVLLLPVGATFVRGEEALDPLFGVGFLAITIGFLVAAVLDARGRVTPRRAALVLLGGWIATVAVDSVLCVGAGWLALAALAGSASPAGRAQTAGS
jgi:hypothetical protein